MRTIFKNKSVLKTCAIARMLRAQAKKKHLSFHTPGHKQKGWDITELVYSDNLSCPHGCIAEAERDIARILGAEKSFILTDGSTSGVLAMLQAAKALGVKAVAVSKDTHKSLFNACFLTGIRPLVFDEQRENKIPLPYTMYELKRRFPDILAQADALFVTSPDYYGNVADLKQISSFCKETGKWLLIDGAHGSHLHFDKEIYAGHYADMWVDGVHKNLPAFTQGAVVSARTAKTADALKKAVDIFRTTSPSYPVMASVEYAVKYPRNAALETKVLAFEKETPRIYFGGDWTKLCALFGENAYMAEEYFIKKGAYPEFCDGNVVMFYLSPVTTEKEFTILQKLLRNAFEKFTYTSLKAGEPTKHRIPETDVAEWVAADDAVGRICARDCGLFPPCTLLLSVGDVINEEHVRLLKRADNVFGLEDFQILVWKEKEKE